MANLSYSKLLEPIDDIIIAMESILTGAFGATGGDQRECYKRIHAYCWGIHTLVMDVITALGIENAATRPTVLDRFHRLIRPTKINLDNLMAGFDGELTEEQQETLAFAASTVASLEHMMGNLWRYSLLKHDRLVYSHCEFDGAALTQKVKAVLTDFIVPDFALPFRIAGDETHLAYAFGEIVHNVGQHAGVDSFSIEAQHYAERIDIIISDSGRGFHSDDISQAFQPFWQSEEQDQGLGLGLYLAKAFIEQSGGHIAMSSEPQNGTTVRVSLALAG